MIKEFRIQLDDEASAAYISFSDKKSVKTEPISNVVNADLDEAGHLVGIELLELHHTDSLFEVAGTLGLSEREIEAIRSDLEKAITPLA